MIIFFNVNGELGVLCRPQAREAVDLVMDFTDPIIRGMSLFHCHLLKQEDKGHDGEDFVSMTPPVAR